jgi:ribonuclease Y
MAKKIAAEPMANAELRLKEFTEVFERRHQKEMSRITKSYEAIKAQVDEREAELEAELKDKESLYNERQSIVDKYENRVKQQEEKFLSRRQNLARLKEDYIKKLEEKTQESKAAAIAALKNKVIEEERLSTAKWLQFQLEEIESHAPERAQQIFNTVLNRFARPYCPERGIGYLHFEDEQQRDRTLGPEQIHLRTVEKICGIDLVYDTENNCVNVYGFDPVRRELGRATIEKMMKERHPWDEKKIENLIAKIKTELFQKIIRDGEKIEKELRLNGLHQEIKNMMGALRYRYSFTQNQYYHCAEVGFLCGLLAAELGIEQADARRAGLLHDLGKAMDHTMEGGHAVIGADFIQKHGEADHIVYAVRAHHFDVTPDHDLDFLVIAADAISGARPGARRSTAQTYSQKIHDLQSIAGQFDGVIDTHVLSAGREIRVYVDEQILDDHKALTLSKSIAEKIESEMAYPGSIKVTVVRQTQAVEIAR